MPPDELLITPCALQAAHVVSKCIFYGDHVCWSDGVAVWEGVESEVSIGDTIVWSVSDVVFIIIAVGSVGVGCAKEP